MKDFILQHINSTRKASFRNCFATLHFATTTSLWLRRTTSQQTTDYGQRTTDNRQETTDKRQRTTDNRPRVNKTTSGR